MSNPTDDRPAPEPASTLGGRTVVARTTPTGVEIVDTVTERTRRPADLLRVFIVAVVLVAMVALASFATATTQGAESDLRRASDSLPTVLGNLVTFLASVGLLAVPVFLTISLLVRHTIRRLLEGLAGGIATLLVVQCLQWLLGMLNDHHNITRLFDSLITRPGDTPLDGYVAAVLAFCTVIEVGRTDWESLVAVTIVFDGVSALAAGNTTAMSFSITVLLGWLGGLIVRYLLGSSVTGTSAENLADALATAGFTPLRIQRVDSFDEQSRRYEVGLTDSQLTATVLDRDQQAAGLFYRLYRAVVLRRGLVRRTPISLVRSVERRALMAYAVAAAGVRSEKLVETITVGPDTVALLFEPVSGTGLRDLPEVDDEVLRRIWHEIKVLHRHQVAHRSLTARNITVGADGQVTLLSPEIGEIAASDIQMRLDCTEFLVESAMLVGNERAVRVAADALETAELINLAPLLQTVVLHRSTRTYLRSHKDLLGDLRSRITELSPSTEPTPEPEVRRVRPRTVFSIIAAIIAGWFLLGWLGKVNIADILREANWAWAGVALAMSALTYLGATFTLSGFVTEPLQFTRTLMAQFAGSFAQLLTPPSVGGVAVNTRYLQKAGIPTAAALATVGVSQGMSFVVHTVLLVVFALLTGMSTSSNLSVPGWVFILLAVVVLAALVFFALPIGRKLFRARIKPFIDQIVPRLLDIATRPNKLAEGLGGMLLLNAAYAGCLIASVEAFGGGPSTVSVIFIYLTGSAVGSIVPTPGGLGAVETTLTGLLAASGMGGGAASTAVLLYRLVSYWLPIPIGWVTMNELQRRKAL